MRVQPRLPPGVSRLTVRRLCYQGAWLRLSYDASSAVIVLQTTSSAVCKAASPLSPTPTLCFKSGSSGTWQMLVPGKETSFTPSAGAQVAADKC